MVTLHDTKIKKVTEGEIEKKVIEAFGRSLLIRRIEMVKLIMKEPGKWSIGELSEKFLVSERMIMKDLVALRKNNIEVRSEKDRLTIFNMSLKNCRGRK